MVKKKAELHAFGHIPACIGDDGKPGGKFAVVRALYPKIRVLDVTQNALAQRFNCKAQGVRGHPLGKTGQDRKLLLKRPQLQRIVSARLTLAECHG